MPVNVEAVDNRNIFLPFLHHDNLPIVIDAEWPHHADAEVPLRNYSVLPGLCQTCLLYVQQSERVCVDRMTDEHHIKNSDGMQTNKYLTLCRTRCLL